MDNNKTEINEELTQNDDKMIDEHVKPPELCPAALGFYRVGTIPPRPRRKTPIEVLNACGMPARIRKTNKLFFDDDIVNDSKSSKPSSSVKTPTKFLKKRKGIVSRYMEVKEDDKEEVSVPTPLPVIIPADKTIRQQIGLRLRNLLNLPKAHKWVLFEWFYSYIDKPFFDGDNEFQMCLQELFVRLKPGIKLTRKEWSKIRSMMGKPRRCSQKFFAEERKELESRRQDIRLLQMERSGNILYVLKYHPKEIPLLLPVGTKVTARLRTPQDGIFTGKVDAVDSLTNIYCITFDKPGLGTHFIPDYEVVGNDFNETISISGLTQNFRPRIGLNINILVPPGRARNSLNRSDPLLDQGFYEIHFKNPVLPRETIGFPIKLLKLLVRLKNTLAFKQSKLQELRDMNTEAELQKTYNDTFSEDFQRRYANIIILLEILNKDLQDYLNEIQTYSSDLPKESYIAEMLAPSYLREKCREMAEEAVQRNNQNTITDESIMGLVTDLATLMLVASHFSSGENSHILRVLEDCIEVAKGRLYTENVESFEKSVETRLHNIQVGIEQMASTSNEQQEPMVLDDAIFQTYRDD